MPTYRLDLVVVGYAAAAIGMPWRADGREWRHDLPMLEPPLAHTAVAGLIIDGALSFG